MKIDVTKLDEQITIRTMVELLGGKIKEYPVVGTCVVVNGSRSLQNVIEDTDTVAISYEWSEPSNCGHADITKQELIRIYIGHKHAGPMLHCDVSGGDDGATVVWRNCYSKGNYGGNWSHGGNWSSASRVTYATATEALRHRDYSVGGLTMDNRYTESSLLLAEISAFVARF